MNIKIRNFAEKYLSNDKLIKYLLFYRILLSFAAEFVVSKFTILGDVSTFLDGTPLEEFGLLPDLFRKNGLKFLIMDDEFAISIISSINFILRIDVLTYCVCAFIGYIGIRRFLKAAESDSKYYKILILLCYSPSFNLWSSIAGKEALIVFAMGVVCGEMIRFFKGEKIKADFLFFISLYFIIIIKKQYIPFILISVPYMMIRRKLNISWITDLILLTGMIASVVLLLYLFRFQIDDYALKIHNIFRTSARSTRGRIFIERFDFFKKMPYLLPLSFWGPTLKECGKSFLHLFSFIESSLIILTFFYMLRGFFSELFKKFRIYYQWFLLGLDSLFLLLFPHYIQAIMNPGAGIRYRTNIYLAVLAFVYIFACIRIKNEKNKFEKRGTLLDEK